MDIKVLIAAHKKYDVPEDDMYLPLHVGCEGKESIGFTGDNTGENISLKNPNYCELTGLYWAWKNLKADYIGMVHYRRYFKGDYKFSFTDSKGKSRTASILSTKEAQKLLEDTDIIVPKCRNYHIETIYSHYANTLRKEDLDVTREIIIEKFPLYLLDFDNVTRGTKAHMFNMFIMKKELFCEYLEWLFEVLKELENRLDVSDYTDFQKRLFGRVSEILLNVWLEKHEYSYKEVDVCNLEGEKIARKGVAMVAAKIFKKKYDRSF